MTHKLLLCAFTLPLLGLTACGGGEHNVKDTLGLTKSSPDEFAVVKRAPLSMPPDYSLRPPQPGAARPQEQATSEQAKQAVFGTAAADGTIAPATAASATPKSSGESALLKAAGAEIADPSVRGKVDYEAVEETKDNRPVVKKILGSNDIPSATVVNANAEAERLRKNKEEGKPVTAGETPSIEE